MSNISRANRATALIDLNVTPTILESSFTIPSSQNMLGGQEAGSANDDEAQNNSRGGRHNPVITNVESEVRAARDPVLTSHSKRRRIGSTQSGVNGDALFINLEESRNTELGGLNSLLAVEHSPSMPIVSQSPTMILGMDVSHGSPGRSDMPSIAAIVDAQPPPPPPPPQEISFKCPVCLGKVEEATTTRCGHIFCNGCLRAAIRAQHKCPTCRTKANGRSIIRVFLP